MSDPQKSPGDPSRDPPPFPSDGVGAEPPYEPEDLEEKLGADGAIDADLPCIRCGYNLRGLFPERSCPECGARVGKSLDFAMERVLCPTCLAPNHPSLPVCSKCSSYMNAAAATSNYFRPIPGQVPRREARSTLDGEPVPPPQKVPRAPRAPSMAVPIVAWGVAAPLMFFFGSKAAEVFPRDQAMGLVLACFALAFLILAIFQTLRYVWGRQEAHYRFAKARRAESGQKRDSAEDNRADDADE